MVHTLSAVPTLRRYERPALQAVGVRRRPTYARTSREIGGWYRLGALVCSMTVPRDSISDELETLVLRFARFAGRIAHDRGLPQEDTDELLQELRLRFWRARKDGLRDLSAGYVRRTAISAALDIIRRRRTNRNVSLDDDEGTATPLASTTAGPGELLDQSELAQRVARAVDALAPARRVVVRMHLQGYKREEIAELLRWSEARTRNLLYRGLADLRNALIAEGIGTREATA
jgi:RNA polymerase sigma-70 factor (ECF subfamily)